MTRTAGARIGCQRPSRFWGLGCPKIYHEVEDTLASSSVMTFAVASPPDCCSFSAVFTSFRSTGRSTGLDTKSKAPALSTSMAVSMLP
ncbi:hypothetical protein [Thiolapillus sp.]|uniref:hypothetical protein n=1 Tax=Thiolapillus sp. TaxID=2017437 RepID=UPI0035AC02C3